MAQTNTSFPHLETQREDLDTKLETLRNALRPIRSNITKAFNSFEDFNKNNPDPDCYGSLELS